ncbi:hypothetical protein L3X38_017033 [Prunus dulcis]|uniref:Uncharacterized protein n=1 Tax=Prunus dulcis TaxID=3755 RepID=A0AAD4Z8S7_PRUDU|nr:hypothetical protein L3X38_017033 [Prunus dulcis]
MSVAQKLLFTSTRSLSVSFQGESYSLQVSKVKPTPSWSTRKGTLEKRKVTMPFRANQSENSKPTEQQRWPASILGLLRNHGFSQTHISKFCKTRP